MNAPSQDNRYFDDQAIEDVNAAIEASTECERILARQWLAQRRATLNLIVYRDQLEDFGKAVWRGTA